MMSEDSVGQSTYEATEPLKSNEKRQFEEIISSLVDVVEDIHRTNKARYEMLNSAFGKQAQANNSRGDMWQLLRNIQGLTLDQMFEAGEKLMKRPECLELFLGISEDARPAYVDRVMKM